MTQQQSDSLETNEQSTDVNGTTDTDTGEAKLSDAPPHIEPVDGDFPDPDADETPIDTGLEVPEPTQFAEINIQRLSELLLIEVRKTDSVKRLMTTEYKVQFPNGDAVVITLAKA